MKIRTSKKDGHKYPLNESGSKSDKNSPFGTEKSEQDEPETTITENDIEDTISGKKSKRVADALEDSELKDVSGGIGSLSAEQRKKIEEHVKSEIVEYRDDGYDGKMYEFENGEEWLIFESIADAEKEAIRRIKDDLENSPEMFTQSWLEHFMDISDTDARLFGIDFGNMMVEDADLEELKDIAQRYDIDFEDPEDKLSGHEDDDNYDERLEELNDKLKTKLYDDVSHARAKEVEKTIKRDGLKSFLCDDEGLCSRDEFFEQYGKWLHINYDEASEDALNIDGVAHFLSPYDGEQVEVGRIQMFRVN